MSLLPWSLAFLKPYRFRVVLLSVLLLSEIALGALQPWPLAIVIDYVLQQHPMPEPFAGWLLAIHGGDRFILLIILVVAGVVLQIINQLVSAYGTQVRSIPGNGWSTICAGVCSNT
jgi:ABC-type multidrug transport system fused ATPase/permease subunit